jgi:hypothetical protein
MLEIVLGICLAAISLGLLAYLYFDKQKEREYLQELQKVFSDLTEKDRERTQKAIDSSFRDYLKHIDKLEKLALPSPVTTTRVQSVLGRMGELADETAELARDANPIEDEKDRGVEMPNDTWAGVVGPETKVAFEDDTLVE